METVAVLNTKNGVGHSQVFAKLAGEEEPFENPFQDVLSSLEEPKPSDSPKAKPPTETTPLGLEGLLTPFIWLQQVNTPLNEASGASPNFSPGQEVGNKPFAALAVFLPAQPEPSAQMAEPEASDLLLALSETRSQVLSSDPSAWLSTGFQVETPQGDEQAAIGTLVQRGSSNILLEVDTEETPLHSREILGSRTESMSKDDTEIQGTSESLHPPLESLMWLSHPLEGPHLSAGQGGEATHPMVSIEQVAAHLERLVRLPEQSDVRLHLDPPELGALAITVSVQGTEVQAQVTAEHDWTRRMLELSVEQLRQLLAERGLQLGGFQVNVGGSFEQTSNQTPMPNLQQAEPSPNIHRQRSDWLDLNPWGRWSVRV